MLEEGMAKMNEAQKELQSSSSSFNDAAGKLTSLNIRLEAEFDSKSDFYKQKVTTLRMVGYGGAACFGLPGLGVAYIVLENNMIPELTAKLESIKKFYQDMKEQVSKAFIDIDNTKTQLQDEIRVIGILKVQAQDVHTTVTMGAADEEDITESATELMKRCKEFRQRHSTAPIA